MQANLHNLFNTEILVVARGEDDFKPIWTEAQNHLKTGSKLIKQSLTEMDQNVSVLFVFSRRIGCQEFAFEVSPFISLMRNYEML